MWIEITDDLVRGAMSSLELDAINLAAISLGQDPLEEITKTAVDEARAHIADCEANQLAAGQTLPERAVHHVLAIIRYRMLTRVDLEVSEARTTEYRDARRFLERVSECKVAIELPDGAIDPERSGTPTVETLHSRPRIASRNQLSGL